MTDLLARCEHGYSHAHCDEHLGKGSHFGVVTHEGGCRGLREPTDSEILSAALNLEGVETVDWCESHFAISSDGRYCDFSPDGDACRIVPVAIIPLPPEAP